MIGDCDELTKLVNIRLEFTIFSGKQEILFFREITGFPVFVFLGRELEELKIDGWRIFE